VLQGKEVNMETVSDPNTLLSIKDLKTYFPVTKGIMKRISGYVKAVDGVSLDVYRGETLGIVGESGCGKTTLGKSILQLVKPFSGSVVYRFDDGEKDLTKLKETEMDEARRKMQIIFQDPYASLNPAFSIFGSFSDPLKRFGISARKEREAIVATLLASVNLPKEYMNRYPNEFSGGQRQRICIARALSVNPEMIVCDEAVSALDASIQAQVLQLLRELQEKNHLTYLFITHDLSVVEYMADRIAVMYLGKIVELADTETLFANPIHPYTKALLSAIPVADINHKRHRITLEGEVPSPINPPSGCSFHTRCACCKEICKTVSPPLVDCGKNGSEHLVRCHFAPQTEPKAFD
jgi:oligopeptide/dipeptide ABC transporter ATP-binding protein